MIMLRQNAEGVNSMILYNSHVNMYAYMNMKIDGCEEEHCCLFIYSQHESLHYRLTIHLLI